MIYDDSAKKHEPKHPATGANPSLLAGSQACENGPNESTEPGNASTIGNNTQPHISPENAKFDASSDAAIQPDSEHTQEQGSELQANQSDDRKSGGAPRNNRNHYRHGLRSSRLPAGSKGIGTGLDKLRIAIEDAVMQKTGRPKISVGQAAKISSAIRHEKTALLAERWLRTEAKNLSAAEKLRFLKVAADATESRDRCLEKLGLDSLPDANDQPAGMIQLPAIETP